MATPARPSPATRSLLLFAALATVAALGVGLPAAAIGAIIGALLPKLRSGTGQAD